MLEYTVEVAFGLAGLFLLYTTGIIIYRLYFHPLAHIPGPPIAISTYLYEWYYDLYLSGQYTWQLKELHQRYGPVIRHNPDQIHINDPDFFEEVYNLTNGRTEKPREVAEVFGPYPAERQLERRIMTCKHRIRRAALNPFFSKKSVNDLVPVMKRPIDLLCGRLEEAARSGETLNMKYFYAATTLDIINDYCFARQPENVLKSDFARKTHDDVDGLLKMSLLNLHIPGLIRFNYYLPDAITKILSPAMVGILDFRTDLSRQVEAIRHGRDKAHEKATHRTIFHDLLSGKLPPAEIKRDRLRDEAFSLVTAGSGTTAYVLRGTAYHICKNQSICNRLHEELKTVMPERDSVPSLSGLEKLPYLTAVIQEGLRVCEPVTHRLGRRFPEKALDYHGKTIPAGTTVSMTSILIHQNENIFTEPNMFKPERWLENKGLERYLVPFNRGSRVCLGLNLARAELYLVLAYVFRRFEFDVSQVVEERDIVLTRDYILGAPARDSPGILVKVERVD